MSTSNRPPQQTLKETGDTVAFLSSIKGGSTRDMMKNFARAQYNVPANIPDTDSRFIGITIAAVTLRHTQKDAQEHPGKIQATMNAIQGQLDQLQFLDSRSARELSQSLSASVAPNLADGAQRVQQEKELENIVNEVIKDSNAQINGLVTAIIDVKATDADVQALFANIRKNIEEINKQATQLNRNVTATQYNLDSIFQKITLDLNNERRKLNIPVTEEMLRAEKK